MFHDLWTTNSAEARAAFAKVILDPEGTRSMYSGGLPDNGSTVSPESYTLDVALLRRPGNVDVQVNLFYDYRNNVAMYPDWQRFLRERQLPLLAVWRRNDTAFVPAGAEAYKCDVPKAEVDIIDAPHFALEGREAIFAAFIKELLHRTVY